MVKNHMKRLVAPRTWNILRKDLTFITRPKPGAHSLGQCIALKTFLSDMTGIVHTEKEAKYLLTHSEVLVNGQRKRDHRAQTGFLDIITVPSLNKQFMMLIDSAGKLAAKEIKKEDADNTLLRVMGKTVMPGGIMQINTMNGRNIIIKNAKDAKTYKRGDTVLYSLKSKKIEQHFSFEKGASIFVFTGKHAGKSGVLEEITDRTIKIKTDKESFETNRKYGLVTGKGKPAIDLSV